jgi:hypothetical protein
MALSRQLYSRGNIPAPDNSTSTLLAKSILWLIKAILKDEVITGTLGAEGAMPAGAKWTCEGSSDSSTANMAGTDLWTATFDGTKIVRASGAVAHSWIVLKSPVALGPYYLCIDWNAANDQTVTIMGSKNAFTGGTITARPTATKEWTVLSGTFCENVTTAHRAHKAMDGNGNFFIETSKNGAGLFNMAFFGLTVSNTVSGEQSPFFTAFQFTTGARGAGRVQGMAVTGRSGDDSGTMTGSFGDLTFSGTTFGGTMQANVLNGAFDTLPVFVGSTGPTLKHGVRGTVPDVEIAGIATVGASDPTTGTQERMLLGDLLVPCSVVPSL